MMSLPAIACLFAAPPNVLLIAVDDLRPDLGCYGVEWADSPNIDRLADQSVLFSRHYVQVATCGASRYSMLTGRSPASSGATGGNDKFYRGRTALSRSEAAGAQSFPELFRRNGYRTESIGKISHTVDNRVFAYDGSGNGMPEVPFAWDEVRTPMGTWGRGWGVFFAYPDGVHREDGGGHRDLMNFTVSGDDDLPDGQIAAQAARSLHELADRDEPFLLAVGFYKPHLPWVAPKKDWDAVRTPPAPQIGNRPETAYDHKSGEFYKYKMPFERPLSADATAACRRAYAACIRYTDRQVGRVLDALEATGEAEQTVVILWGDHGWFVGDWDLWGKHSPLELANRSPLLISAPATPAGVCTAPTETIDLYPTLVELCHLENRETEHPLDGDSLLQRLHNPSGALADDNDVAISYWNKSVAVRSDRYRVVATRQKNGEWSAIELYEPESATPARNVAADHEDVVAELLRRVPAM